MKKLDIFIRDYVVEATERDKSIMMDIVYNPELRNVKEAVDAWSYHHYIRGELDGFTKGVLCTVIVGAAGYLIYKHCKNKDDAITFYDKDGTPYFTMKDDKK